MTCFVDRHSWCLSLEQHYVAKALTSDDLALLKLAAAQGHIEVGEPGGRLALLADHGFIAIKANGTPRAHALITINGLRARSVSVSSRMRTNSPTCAPARNSARPGLQESLAGVKSRGYSRASFLVLS
jgi:hypothetical protein